ncbi:MAG TPA: GAF domain-containing protein, partial [Flavobacterium sp.]|nr:GAF domain-containing protein [Flavobacterium sp.]
MSVIIAVAYYYGQKKKRETSIQNLLNYFAHSTYDHLTVNEIIWDICRNCISSLNFEDCVIYLLDEERKVLSQKAAYGPKSPQPFEIFNPIEIPLGKGIVGSVAASGEAVIVNDTSRDPRYIVDDRRRLSEISVPLIHKGGVIGVIDAENSRKNFFTQQHLQTMQTIASLCSAKISQALAHEAIQESKMEVMELNMKMTESRFLNLR